MKKIPCLRCKTIMIPFIDHSLYQNQKKDQKSTFSNKVNSGLVKLGKGMSGFGKNMQNAFGMESLIDMYKCPKCGYVEMYVKEYARK